MLTAFVVCSAICARGQEVTDAFAVTASLATQSERNTRDGTEIILSISNRSPIARELWTDGDDYRVLLIDNLGRVLLPPAYKKHGTPEDRRVVRSRSRRILPPGETSRLSLNLTSEFQTNALPGGPFWAIITRKTTNWNHVIVAPPVMIQTEKDAANNALQAIGDKWPQPDR